MAHWVCTGCGGGFKGNRKKGNQHHFCCPECYHTWQSSEAAGAGRFLRGSVPWNKGMKGIHLSPESEYKPGREATNRLPVGSVTIRCRNRDGKPRAFVKTAEPNVWHLRARLVWEKAHGPIQGGMLVHHEDGDTLNDRLSNLRLVCRAVHIGIHRLELTEARLVAFG